MLAILVYIRNKLCVYYIDILVLFCYLFSFLKFFFTSSTLGECLSSTPDASMGRKGPGPLFCPLSKINKARY